MIDKRLDELQKRMAYLLQDLDDYGYSREETLEDLNSNNPSTEKEVVKEYFDLKSRIHERLNYMNLPKTKEKNDANQGVEEK